MTIENIKYVTIIATENCNLKCTYCYEHFKTNNIMSVDLVKSIIHKELIADDCSSTVLIDFFGGEPFLEISKIIEIVDYFKELDYRKKFAFSASTNGTIIDENIKQWLQLNKSIFSIGLSLDGTKEMHDKNRSNSFDDIDIDFFIKCYPEMIVKMTISLETLGDLARGVKFCHSLGIKHINCNLAQGINWSKMKETSILEQQLYELIEFYLENPQLEPCTLLNYNIENIAFYDQLKAHKYCGVGTRMKLYDINGNTYPCQYFLPISINKKSEKKYDFTFSDEIDIKLLDENCQKCIAVDICPSCYGSNYANTGNIYGRDKGFCKLTKIIIKANAYFRAMQWQKQQLDLTKEKEAALLKGITLIQDKLLLK